DRKSSTARSGCVQWSGIETRQEGPWQAKELHPRRQTFRLSQTVGADCQAFRKGLISRIARRPAVERLLEISTICSIVTPCQFTNFIAKAAKPIAKCLFDRKIGKGPGARAAGRVSCQRSCRFLPLRPARL